MMQKNKCLLGNHDYEVIQELTRHSRRIGCPHCKKTWGMNDMVECIVEWDSKLEDMYTNKFGLILVKPRWKDGH